MQSLSLPLNHQPPFIVTAQFDSGFWSLSLSFVVNFCPALGDMESPAAPVGNGKRDVSAPAIEIHSGKVLLAVLVTRRFLVVRDECVTSSGRLRRKLLS